MGIDTNGNDDEEEWVEDKEENTSMEMYSNLLPKKNKSNKKKKGSDFLDQRFIYW